MTIREEALQVLCDKAAKLFGLDEAKKAALSRDTEFVKDLNCTSVNFVQMSAALEDEFEIEINFQVIINWKNFGEACDYVAGELGE